MNENYQKPGLKTSNQFKGPTDNIIYKEVIVPNSAVIGTPEVRLEDSISAPAPFERKALFLGDGNTGYHDSWSHWQFWNYMYPGWDIWYAGADTNSPNPVPPLSEGDLLRLSTYKYMNYTDPYDFLNPVIIEQAKADGFCVFVRGGWACESSRHVSVSVQNKWEHLFSNDIFYCVNHCNNGINFYDWFDDPQKYYTGTNTPNKGYGDWPWVSVGGVTDIQTSRYGPQVPIIMATGTIRYYEGYGYSNGSITSYGPQVEFGDSWCGEQAQSWEGSFPARWTYAKELRPFYNVYDIRQFMREMSFKWNGNGNSWEMWNSHNGYGSVYLHHNKWETCWSDNSWSDRPYPNHIGMGSPLSIGARISNDRKTVYLVWRNFYQSKFDHTEVWLNDSELIYAGPGKPTPWPSETWNPTSAAEIDNGIVWNVSNSGNATLHLYTVSKHGERSLPECYTVVPLPNLVAHSNPGVIN